MNSADRLLRKDEYPTMKLPRLATQVTTKPRRPPIPRVLPEESEVHMPGDEISNVTVSLCVNASSNTEVTGMDME